MCLGSGSSTSKANPSLRIPTKQADEEAQHRLTQRRLENAKFEITLTAEATPKDTQNQIASDSHTEVTKKLQAVVQKAFTVGPTLTIRGVQKLKSNDIRFKCETEEEAQCLWKIDWTEAYPDIEVQRLKFGVVIHGISLTKLTLTTTWKSMQGNSKNKTRS